MMGIFRKSIPVRVQAFVLWLSSLLWCLCFFDLITEGFGSDFYFEDFWIIVVLPYPILAFLFCLSLSCRKERGFRAISVWLALVVAILPVLFLLWELFDDISRWMARR